MKKYVLIVSCALLLQRSFANSSKGSLYNGRRFKVRPGIGYLWNGHNNIEMAIKPYYLTSQYPEHKLNNINMAMGIDIFKHHVTYGSKFIGLGYMWHVREKPYPLVIDHFCVYNHVSCYYSTTTVNGVNDRRIIAEIARGYTPFSIALGYGYILSHEHISWMRSWRIAIRIPGY